MSTMVKSHPKFVPFTESNDHVLDPDNLRSIFAEDGYLFLREFVPLEAARLRDDIIGVLKRHEYVEEDSTGSAHLDGQVAGG